MLTLQLDKSPHSIFFFHLKRTRKSKIQGNLAPTLINSVWATLYCRDPPDNGKKNGFKGNIELETNGPQSARVFPNPYFVSSWHFQLN